MNDHLLLVEIMDAREITAKEFTRVSGLAASTVYKYRNGTLTIPIAVWQLLFKLTQDMRITRLVTGSVPVVIVPLKVVGGETVNTLEALLEVRAKEIEWELSVLDVIKNGGINNLNSIRIDEVGRRFPDVVKTIVQLQQVITHEFDIDQDEG